MFLLIQMPLPQKQGKQPNQPPGAGSYKSHLSLGSASCQPGAAGGREPLQQTLTPASQHYSFGGKRVRASLHIGYSTCLLVEIHPQVLWGWPRPPESLQSCLRLQWSLKHRSMHTDTSMNHIIIIFRFGCWWFAIASPAKTFYNHLSSFHVLIACQREADAFPFPLSLALCWQRQVLLEIF